MRTKTTARSKPFTLSFWGGATVRMPRYRTKHATYEEARAEAYRVLARLENRAAHPAIIDGPGCGRDGVTIV